jgi:hypothetical protein
VKDYPEQGDGYEYFVDFGYVSQGSKKTLVYGIKNITDGDAILELDDLTALNTPKNKVTLTFRTGEEATSAALPTPVQATPATHIFVAVGSLVYAHFEYEATDKVDSDEQDLKLTTNDDDINGSGNRGNSAVTFKVTARSKEAKIQVSPSSLDFGEVQINQGGKKLVVTIGNPGDSDLTLKPTSGLKNPAGTYYSLNPASLDRIVPAMGTLPVEVTFAPTAIQGENNWLVLDSDDKSTPHIEVPLKGKGTDPTLLITSTPVATGNPPTVNYGSVIKGTTTAATFSVKNVGFGSLLLDNVVLTQAAGNYFQIAELAKNGSPASFPITLAEQGADTVTFKVNLTPQVIGTVTGSLKFANSDAKNKDYIINLTSFVQNNKGEPCQYDADCSTGFCTDGVCCEERCTAACERCDKSPNKGNCVAADLGVPDPNQKCAVQDKTTCGTNGLCGGARAECQKWNNQTVCQNASCSTAVLNLPHYCNGTGTCTEGGTQNCTPYACAGTACKSSCTATADCAPNYSCNVGLHVCLKNDGQQCGSSSECYNNNCCSGYCRNLTNDANNCGSCGRVCQQNHASNPCVSSVCTPSCNSGFNNCDSNPINGCEYDMSTYLNSSGSAEYLGAKPGEEKCATALFCLVQASRETFATTSGHQSKWYYAKVQDNSGCNTDNSHKVTLSVPYGVTYDLNVYYPAASTLQHSISVSNGSGTVYPRMKNTEFYYWLEVKFRSGSYCGSWTLVDEWNRCLE